MATNLKAKKKTGTYDNKIILWISAALAAFVILVVGLFTIITYSTNYVAKVNGSKIYTYEYTYFLQEAIEEKFEEPEGYADMTSAEKQKAFEKFFTDEVKAECQEEALEKARIFKASYDLAVKAGYKLTAEERANAKSYVDYMVSQYMYSLSLDQETAVFYITGGSMTLAEYKEYSIRQAAIEKYKTELKKDYTVTTEEMKEIYDKDPDEYRTLTGRVYKFAIPSKPSVPLNKDGKEISKDTTDAEEKAEYTKYEESLAEYEQKVANFLKLCDEIETAINAGEKYTLYDRDYVTYEIKKDKDGKEVILVKDGDFEALCALSSWTSASSNKGVITVGAGNESGVDEIDEYMLQMQWNEARDGFIFVEKKDEAETEDSASTSSSSETSATEAESKVTPSTLKRIEIKNDDGVLTALYLVRVEDIDDFDTKVEQKEDSEEETLNTVQSGIKTTILEDKAVAELEEMIAAADKKNNKYAVTSKKEDRLAELLESMF
ncbi:MAG: hypothetical protein IKU26_03495 [Clostridia bacterium]|nr:hypothetical protein [Clostridia bacterium]